jgi:hypothetical protein
VGREGRRLALGDSGMWNKDEEARKLADAHYKVEEGITQIFRIVLRRPKDESRPDEPIKLLEVNEATVPLGIRPVGFGPAPAWGLHFPSLIIQITPGEYEEIQNRTLKLPKGWTIGDLLPNPYASGV